MLNRSEIPTSPSQPDLLAESCPLCGGVAKRAGLADRDVVKVVCSCCGEFFAFGRDIDKFMFAAGYQRGWPAPATHLALYRAQIALCPDAPVRPIA